MEQVIPGEDPDDPFNDPITRSNDRKDCGDYEGACKILMDLCRADLRCLDAHAHLGNLMFDSFPKIALRHYEAGVRIGELSLSQDFEGLLPWGMIDNRPFLRCLSGYGLCLWRLKKSEEAGEVFKRMLWLNPTDNQGVRVLIADVHAGVPWEIASARD
jgi:tetratricopeptide (TPR) repeat protein